MPIPSNNLLVKNLVEYGLTEKEAKIYIGLLELGSATVSEIAKNTGINRSSTYVVLEALKKQGLVGISNDKKVQEYVATSPQALVYSIEKEEKKQEVIKKKINEIVPELKAISKEAKKSPKVRVFEGKDGLINALEESLDNNQEKLIRLFSSAENALNISPEYWDQYGKKRIGLGIRQVAILADNLAARTLFSMGAKLYDAVLIPQEKYPFPVDMMITDDKIGYLTIENGSITTIIIENNQIADVMKTLFDIAWKESERMGKKMRPEDKIDFTNLIK